MRRVPDQVPFRHRPCGDWHRNAPRRPDVAVIPNDGRPARHQHVGLCSPLYRGLDRDAHRWRNDDLPDLRLLLVGRPLPPSNAQTSKCVLSPTSHSVIKLTSGDLSVLPPIFRTFRCHSARCPWPPPSVRNCANRHGYGHQRRVTDCRCDRANPRCRSSPTDWRRW